jgi:hypothetical protein
MKKNRMLGLILTFIVILNASALANISVKIDNTPIEFNTGTPVNQDGTTLVPMRKIFESLGCTVSWEDSTQTVTASKDDIVIQLTVGLKIASKNGTAINLTAPPRIIDGTTYVPPRFVAESLGYTVSWDENTQTVSITTTPSAFVAPTVTTPVEQPTNNTQTYYWTPSGKSYHTTKACNTLSRSKTILSGTLEEAITAGKSDPCNKCN